MNEYTEFDTAAEMQKALDRKKAAYGVPYQSLTETCEVNPDTGIIVDKNIADIEAERGREAWFNDDVFDFDAQSPYFQEAYEEAWFETVNPSTDGDNHDQAWSGQMDSLYWRFKEQEDKRVNNLIAKDERPSFAPTDGQIAALILAVLLALSLDIDQAMKGDLAAMRGMALADVEASVGSER